MPNWCKNNLRIISNGEKVLDYWHRNGHISIESVVYDEVLHGRDVMQLERKEVRAVTTYTFRR